jgi:hypothetical protein
LTLSATKYLPALEGIEWHNATTPEKSLPAQAQLTVKRSKISASIILKESDEKAKFDLFQRLNTGGSQLSPQEVRNCLLVMLNKGFFDKLKELAEYPAFSEVTALSDRPIEESYHLELALRFLVMVDHAVAPLKSIRDLGTFLTDAMTTIATDKNYRLLRFEKAFKETFDILSHFLKPLATMHSSDTAKRRSVTKVGFWFHSLRLSPWVSVRTF